MNIETLHRTAYWEQYGYKVKMLIENPKNKGTITSEEAKQLQGTLFEFTHGSPENGMLIHLYWVLDAHKRVVASRYTLFGPPALLAVADMAALLCRNKTVPEIAAIRYKSLEYFLRDNPDTPALPREKQYTILFVLEALRRAVARIEGASEEESPVVCECSGAQSAFVRRAIEEFDLHSVEEITDYTLAGAFCGSCIAPGRGPQQRNLYLQDLLKEVRAELAEKKSRGAAVSDKPFAQMSPEEKRQAINAVIDEHIRSMLVMDGGDMEILDLKENGEHTDLYIRYLGACNGCASASTGTLFAIEGILKQKLDPHIRVIPL